MTYLRLDQHSQLIILNEYIRVWLVKHGGEIKTESFTVDYQRLGGNMIATIYDDKGIILVELDPADDCADPIDVDR